MAEWLTLLDRLDIPDGAVTGLSASDKPVLKGKLLQLPAADRPHFFDGPGKHCAHFYLMCRQVSVKFRFSMQVWHLTVHDFQNFSVYLATPALSMLSAKLLGLHHSEGYTAVLHSSCV